MTIDVERGPWPALIERAQAITDRLATDEADSRRRLGFLAYHPQRLIEMLKGSRKLSVAEYEALAEAWYYRFGAAADRGRHGPRAAPPKPKLPPPDYIVAPKEAAKLMGVSLSYLQRAEKDGRLPKRVRMSKRRVARNSCRGTWCLTASRPSRPIATRAWLRFVRPCLTPRLS
jgi:predicted DNA-binding transcriptional regulator AlpA